MSSLIPKLTLFPTYQGGPRLQAGNTLNANSSFRLPATEFTAAYGINMPASTDRTGDNYFFRANADQTLSQVPTSSANNYTQALDLSNGGGVQATSALNVSDAPTSPNKYEAFIRQLEVSDYNYADLMAQPSFKLSNIGPGYLVTTDGAGHVDSITVDPSIQAARGRVGVNDAAYLMADRADITMRATLRSANAVNGNNPVPPVSPNAGQGGGINGLQNELGLNPTGNNIFQLGRPELEGKAVFPNAGQSRIAQQGGLNPILDRLRQLQPQNPGLPVAGFDSQIDAHGARQIAAGQAKLDVSLSPGFRENLTSLQTATIEQGKVYSQTQTSQMIARQMDGMIPMAPSLPAPARSASDSGMAGFAQPDFGRNAMGGMADAVDKRGRDGYLPFAFSSGQEGGTSAGTGGSGFGGQPNPFGGGSGGFSGTFAGTPQGQSGQPQQRRQPLYYQA